MICAWVSGSLRAEVQHVSRHSRGALALVEKKPHPCCTVARACSCALTNFKAPPFCVWASDAMPRLCPLCAHRKLLAVPGIGRADFPIPYQGLRCCSNLSASIFIHKAAAALLYPIPCRPNANPSLGARVGTDDGLPTIGFN
ncbi:hypothetical protein GOODEAATRI_012036 [Goodea atripinnis]|uniref:Uncharacterized protein n=1 Tax=Goodea atripinnis TaxID=208336 RepID=A0ABV0N9Z2_9TELE